MTAALTDSTNHHVLVKLPKLLKHGNRLLIGQESGHQIREHIVKHEVATLNCALADRQEQVVWQSCKRLFENGSDLLVKASIGKFEEALDDFRDAPQVHKGRHHVRRHRDVSLLAELTVAPTKVERPIVT